MHSVRQTILEILKESGAATVADLAEQLDMAPVSVRHHLDILQGDNLIRVGRVERNGTVGRPQQSYVLTEEATSLFPNNFAALAAGLVRQMKQMMPPEMVKAAFQAVAHEIARPIDPEGLQQLPIEDRLDQIVAFLNDRGYLARWETNPAGDGDSYLLHKFNCPYRAVSGEHRELCTMDQLLINELVGNTCCRTRSVADDANCCTYEIGRNTQFVGDFLPAAVPQEILLVV